MGVSIHTYRVRIWTFQPSYCSRTIKNNQIDPVIIDFKTVILVALLSCSLPIFVHLNQDSLKISTIPIQYPITTSFDPSNQPLKTSF